MSFLTFKKEISFGENIIKVFNLDGDYLGYIKKEGEKYKYLVNQNTSYESGCLREIDNVINQLQNKRGKK